MCLAQWEIRRGRCCAVNATVTDSHQLPIQYNYDI